MYFRKSLRGGACVLLRLTPVSSLVAGSTRASWLCKHPLGDLSSRAGNPKPGPDSDEGSWSSGTCSSSGAPPAACASSESLAVPVQQSSSRTPGSNSQPRSSSSAKESDILSDEDDDGFSEGVARRSSGDGSSPMSAIDAQFLQLKLSEDAAAAAAPAPCVQPESVGDTPETQPRLIRGQFGAVKRKSSSFRRSQSTLLKTHSRSLDSQTDADAPAAAATAGGVDLNALLEREFSVHSLTSVVNEDCFYEPAEGCAAEPEGASSS